MTAAMTWAADQVAALDWLRQVAGAPPTDAQLSSDSRTIRPGDIFFAFPVADIESGAEVGSDGRRYIADAIERGAAGVLYESLGFEWDAALDCPHLALSDLQQQSGYIASAYYKTLDEAADHAFFSVAVTGTNGKTSCAYWLGQVLSHTAPAAVVGTLGAGLFVNGVAHRFDATGYTTPDAVLLQRKLAELRTLGASAVALEASSIGLAQGRMNGMPVDVALFTNLTHDHLDYHHDMATYERAKTLLFERAELQHAVLNLDDALGLRLAQHLQQRGVAVIGYSLNAEQDAGSMPASIPVLRASALRMSYAGTSFHVASPFGSAQIKSRLVGQFNVSNLLGVLGVLLAKGMVWEAAVTALSGLTAAPGRMQQFGGQDMPLIVIDYAHTPDALEKTLASLREIATQRDGQLWCVFGCGGDRDSSKRAAMGRVAEGADHVILTSDNPRSEDPLTIIAQIHSGMQHATPRIMQDRAAAILWAVRHAAKQDVVLLAGKGHEMYQEVNGKKQPFLDADHTALALAARSTMLGAA